MAEAAGYWLPPEFFDDDKQTHLVDSDSFNQKRRVMPTFSGRSGAASPPNDAVGDLMIYLAKLKLNGADNNSARPGPLRPSAFRNIYGCGMRYGEPQFYRGWPVQQNPGHVGRPITFGGGGTGVYHPRRCGDVRSEDCNTAHSPGSLLGPGYISKGNLHAIDQRNFGTGFVFPGYDMLVAQGNLSRLQLRRSLRLEGSSRANCGVCLPREWTY